MEMKNVETKELISIKILDPYGFIYITTNMINGKKYIGQKKFDDRSRWKSYLGSGIALSRAINKYGKENFNREIIAITYSKEESDSVEKKFIKEHHALESIDYYNLSIGGDSGSAGAKYIFSDEHKRKISKGNKGKHHSDETKQKMSIAQKGKSNPEYKKHLDEIHMQNIKITDQKQLLEIRNKYATGKYTQKKLAVEYLVCAATICDIVNFKGGYKKEDDVWCYQI